jgi:hypothetical protein
LINKIHINRKKHLFLPNRFTHKQQSLQNLSLNGFFPSSLFARLVKKTFRCLAKLTTADLVNVPLLRTALCDVERTARVEVNNKFGFGPVLW